MSVLTFGHLRTTPLVISAEISLDQFREALRARQYKFTGEPAQGFCRIDLEADDDVDGAPTVDRDRPGVPSIQVFTNVDRPERRVLLARHLRDVENPRLRGLGVPDELLDGLTFRARYDQRLVDVAIVQSSSGLLAIVPTQNSEELEQVSAALETAVRSVDGDGKVCLPGAVGQSFSADFFLWVLWTWYRGTGETSPTLRLVDMRELRATSRLGPVTISRQGIVDDRIDVLGAVAQGHEIGPMKVTLEHSRIGLTADVQLAMDGSFDVHRSGSHYRSLILGPAEFGVRAVADVATVLLPELRGAHTTDSDWTQRRIAGFRRWSANEIVRIVNVAAS